MTRYLYMTVCQNLRCIGEGTILTGFIFNDSNTRCEACGNVAAALAQVRFPARETDKRNADRIDGFDSDDLGESPDY